jgi:glycosyltransferase involved in cell wall biosynthesis
VVCPSLYEGFGITLLEGFTFGKPVIASDIPPHREVGNGAAVWFDASRNAPEELATRMAEVLDEPARAEEFAARGRARATVFSWDVAAARLDEVYQELNGV